MVDKETADQTLSHCVLIVIFATFLDAHHSLLKRNVETSFFSVLHRTRRLLNKLVWWPLHFTRQMILLGAGLHIHKLMQAGKQLARIFQLLRILRIIGLRTKD